MYMYIFALNILCIHTVACQAYFSSKAGAWSTALVSCLRHGAWSTALVSCLRHEERDTFRSTLE